MYAENESGSEVAAPEPMENINFDYLDHTESAPKSQAEFKILFNEDGLFLLPESLRKMRIWLPWKAEPKENGGFKKNPGNGWKNKGFNLNGALREKESRGWDGVGITIPAGGLLVDGGLFVAYDLDRFTEAELQTVKDSGLAVMRSVSGTGFHAYGLLSELPKDRQGDSEKEVFYQNHFVAVSGVLEGMPQEAFVPCDAFHRTYISWRKPKVQWEVKKEDPAPPASVTRTKSGFSEIQVGYILSQLSHEDFGCYNERFENIVCSLHHHYNGSDAGLEKCIEFCRDVHNFDEATIRSKWSGISNYDGQKKSMATLAALARKKGCNPSFLPTSPSPTLTETKEKKDDPFPVEALGDLLGGVVSKIAQEGQIPLSLVALSGLCTASFISQHLVSVVDLNGKETPVSLMGLVVAESSSRKSTAEDLLMGEIKKFERAFITRQAARIEAWERACEDCAKENLTKPKEPPSGMLICEEPTAEGIFDLLRYGVGTGGLFTSEGVGFFGGHGMTKANGADKRTIAGMCSLYDSGSHSKTRSSKENTAKIYDTRFSACIMVQPVVYESLEKSFLAAQGVFGRFLMVRPKTLRGTRFISNVKPEVSIRNSPEMERWDNACRFAMEQISGDFQQEIRPIPLHMSDEVYRIWADFFNEVEACVAPHKSLDAICEQAQKTPNTALRISGSLAFLDDMARPEITPAHMERAVILARWFLREALRMENLDTEPQDQKDAEQILEKARVKGWTEFGMGMKSLLTRGNLKGSTSRISAAMELLVESGKAIPCGQNKNGVTDRWKFT